MGNTLSEKGLPRWLYVLLVQIVLFALFLSVCSLQGQFVESISLERGQLWAQVVPFAFNNYFYTLVDVFAFAVVANLVVRFKRGEAVTIQSALLDLVFNFFLFFIVASRLLQFELVGDDAFIDYRYVDHFVSSLSLDYNASEKVMGFTSHLHELALALLSFLCGRPPTHLLSLEFNCLLQCATFGLVYFFVRNLFKSPLLGIVGAGVFALSVFEMMGSAIGKERPLAVFVMVLAMLAFERGRLKLFAWASVALGLVRPEGAIWLVLAFLFSLRQSKANWKIWIAPGALFVFYHLLLTVYFGTPIPHAALVKTSVYLKRNVPFAAFCEIIRYIGVSIIGAVPFFQTFEIGYRFLILGPCGLFAVILALILSRGRQILQLYFLCVLGVLFFYSLPNSWIFNWYFLWFALVPVLLPALFISPFYARIGESLAARLVCGAVIALTLFAQVSVYPVMKLACCRAYLPIFLFQDDWGRFAIYRACALEIKKMAAPGDVVAVTEPGIIGFFYGGPVIDLGGLVSHKVVPFYGQPQFQGERKSLLYAPPPAAIEEFKPRFLCFHDGLVGKEFLTNEFIKSRYKRLKFYPLNIYDGTGIAIYERQP